MKNVNDVVNPRPYCRAGLHPMIEENVWVKPSTKQRRCRQCMKDKRDRKKGMYVLGSIWSQEQLKAASLPLLTMQQERLQKDIAELRERLFSAELQLNEVDEIRKPKVEALSNIKWD